MPQGPSNALLTSDFREEFEADTAGLFRRRFRRFLLVAIVFWLLVSIVRWVPMFLQEAGVLPTSLEVVAKTIGQLDILRPFATAYFISDVTRLAAYIAVLYLIQSLSLTRSRLEWLSQTTVAVHGAIIICFALYTAPLYITTGAANAARQLFPPSNIASNVFLPHVLAAAMLPWTARQALAPGVVCSVFFGALCAMHPSLTGTEKLLSISLYPIAFLPGIIVSWAKHTRRLNKYKLDFLQKRYGELRRELFDAQRVHEAMFPKPITDGCLRFWYEYEPMRSIGGDFVFVAPHRTEDQQLSIVLMDVTGHGIAAALTVNRLYGELYRLYAEHPDLPPGNTLKLLNRYVQLTLAPHSIFATALCLRIDARTSRIEYASGGHPPAFIRGIDGTVHELESTALVLGACADDEFHPAPATVPFHAGDTLIGYTDGALEARNQDGRMIGVDGMRRLVASNPLHIAMLARRTLAQRPVEDSAGALARAILEAVDSHRDGPPADDTLIIEITRALGTPEPHRTRRQAQLA